MKPLFILIGLALLFSCSPKYGIQHKWVFTIDRYRGNVQVDENGNPVSKGVITETIIYLEIKPTDSIAWQRAIINGTDYNIISTSQVSSPVNPGSPKTGSDPMLTIESTGENKLYRMVLMPADPDFIDKDPSAPRKITLSGTKNGKAITIDFIGEAIPLHSQPVP